MLTLPDPIDVLIVGSGHAGIEAALASARLGCRTLMLTQNLDTIGQMSCNPAIGGSAKSHIVKEIDALGGAMAINADATGIQFRILNRSKGEAVWATRVQCDKKAYQFRLKAILEKTRNLRLLQGTATTLLVSNRRAVGVTTDLGVEILAKSVVITAGTFLRGLLHVGEQSKAGGRMADTASSLSDSIRTLGFEAGRFKTGTPCRLNGNSIDFGSLELQGGDEPPPRLSFVETVPREKHESFTLNFAGQINGTSGYEEAAGQGLIAGINAGLKAQDRDPFTLSKEISYIGVLIDDLTTRGTDEPYRMFTSRAQNRLALREDNADLRLTELGAGIGLVGKDRMDSLRRKQETIASLESAIDGLQVNGRPLRQALKDPHFNLGELPLQVLAMAPHSIWRHLLVEMKYAGYLAQQMKRITHERIRADCTIPAGFDFNVVPGLRSESRQKLGRFRPTSLGAARRIPGITAADLSILDIWLNGKPF